MTIPGRGQAEAAAISCSNTKQCHTKMTRSVHGSVQILAKLRMNVFACAWTVTVASDVLDIHLSHSSALGLITTKDHRLRTARSALQSWVECALARAFGQETKYS